MSSFTDFQVDSETSIVAELKKFEYITNLSEPLKVFELDDFMSGKLSSKGSFVLRIGGEEYSFSQWVSPKRTRTFPFARVYNTLSRKNRVTLIPFCKDKGADGDRDFLQRDTVSLMSLLNVYVIVGYYASVEKNERPEQRHKNKISKQIFDYYYVNKQLNKLQSYHSSALHWNLDQVEQLSEVAELTLKAYRKISNRTSVLLHSEDGIQKRIEITKEDAGKFRNMSRQLARHAQIRETLTEQPKEKTLGKKAIITLKNLLGGVYYWTVDECFVVDGHMFMVEKNIAETSCYHPKMTSKMPS